MSFKLLELGFQIAGCSNRCRHCFSLDEPPIRDLVPFAVIEQVLEGFHALTRGENARVERLGFLPYAEFFTHSRYADLLRLTGRLGVSGGYSLPTSGQLIGRSGDWRQIMELIKEAGFEKFQCSFFGTGHDHDRYAGRRGSFHDMITASKRAVAAGLKLSWQCFAFTDTLHEIPEWLALYRQVIGDTQDVTCRVLLPSLAGRAFGLESVRPTSADLAMLPKEVRGLLVGGLASEREWCEKVLAKGGMLEDYSPVDTARMALLQVSPDLRVFYSFQQGWPRDVPLDFLLGDLHRDSPGEILDRYTGGYAPGIAECEHPDVAMLAERYGDPANQRLYWFRSIVTKWLISHLRGNAAS
jgi:hypothetical protein